MARESTGQVLERKGKLGTTYATRVRAYGERHYLSLGYSWDGYTRRQAETEPQNLLADIRRCTWKPPQPLPADQEDLSPIPTELYPHSLRRTFASLLYLCGENPV